MALKSCSHAFSYDVFLSFRGEDTRHGFTGNLYKALHHRGIHTFFDDEELHKGEEITAALKKAIEGSMIAIAVLSNNYASSSFCLDELATILRCSDRKGLLVIPVFYDVDPSHVRHQRGSYGEALAKHEKRFKAKKLDKWKKALHQLADISGFHFKHGDEYEHEFIGRIVEFVSSKINPALLHVAEYPVGLDSQVLEVRKLLDVGSGDGVHMIGIHGMGGVGKTTLALAVYNSIVAHFDASCFLQNVREKANKHGLEHLQSIILSEILGEKKIQLASQPQGISKIQSRLKRKKVLLILDDVDKHEQLRAIAGGLDWFGPGSRVIITTRDKHLLAPHDVKRTYEVKELNKNEALRLLTWKAFKTEKVDPSYEEVLNRAVTYASGLPLALEVIGSNLFGKSIQEWKSAINKYKRIPSDRILKKLKVSFDALEEEEKNVFLDIVFCCKGYALEEVEHILCAHYGDGKKYHIGVLVEKSLIKLHCDGTVQMHDLIEDMGKEIVRQESQKEPGARSRLWSREDIIQVLENNTGTSTIEIICVDFPIFDKEIVQWNGKAFKKMKNLKTLIIRNGNFSKGPKYLPNSLRVLEWQRYPSHCLPSDFHPKKLVRCMLPDGCFTSHEVVDILKKFVHVKILNFDRCGHLTQIPDVSSLPNLEEFSFKYCETLTTVHDSVGELPKLKILSAKGCSKLTTFPNIKLTSLVELELSNCSHLESFPEISGKMENITELFLRGTPIKELPLSFQNLIRLQELWLIDCGIVQLRSSIIMMSSLTLIGVSRCKLWQSLKEEEGEEKVGSIVPSKVYELFTSNCNLYDNFFSIGFTRFAHVLYLDLSGNNFTILPECIKEFQSLKRLDVSNCKHLQKISGIPPNLKSFEARNCKSLTPSSISMFLNQELHEARKTVLVLPGNRIPKWFNHQSRGPSSSFWFRNKFPPKLSCLLIAPVDNVFGFIPMVFINGKTLESPLDREKIRTVKMDHTHLFDLRWSHGLIEVPLENEWNHVEITYAGVMETSMLKATGIHVFQQEEINIEDIRFTDPYEKIKLDDDDDLNNLESQNHRLLKKA